MRARLLFMLAPLFLLPGHHDLRSPSIMKALCAFASSRLCVTPFEEYDLVIRNGRVVDGSGNPAFFADVAVKDGRIAAIGDVNGKAKETINAKGLIVAPGFIDVHTHADELGAGRRAANTNETPVESWQQRAENFLRM